MEGEQEKTFELISRLQQGDERAREELVNNYQGYIINMAAKYAVEKGDVLQTDAYSVALIAFNEAADKYARDRGASFATFAGQIMKRRLIDLIRSKKKFTPEIATAEIPEFSTREEGQAGEMREELAGDIVWFQKQLARFNVELEDLVTSTPKHHDTRCRVIQMAKQVVNEPELLERFYRKKTLPYKNLLFNFRCNPKTIQRHRKYIIAVIIALSGSSLYLKDYVLNVAKGCDDYES